MLKQENAIATVAVKEIAPARKFYEEILGLRLVHTEQDLALTYEAGAGQLLVYQSDYARTNQATAVTWDLGDRLMTTVNELRNKGVKFEHYDLPDMKRDGDLHIAHGMKAAWFKDPDGNIHALMGS
jgi:catechol 2,3-dioxygenase-like lactoylglutathione lyase family enzyme